MAAKNPNVRRGSKIVVGKLTGQLARAFSSLFPFSFSSEGGWFGYTDPYRDRFGVTPGLVASLISLVPLTGSHVVHRTFVLFGQRCL
jgi:hypothetical protein